MSAHRPCITPMLATETACDCSGGASWMLAHTLVTAFMLDTETACGCRLDTAAAFYVSSYCYLDIGMLTQNILITPAWRRKIDMTDLC